MRRLEDDLTIFELNSMILNHAGNLDVSFFEDPGSQDVLHIEPNKTPQENLSRFVGGTLQRIFPS